MCYSSSHFRFLVSVLVGVLVPASNPNEGDLQLVQVPLDCWALFVHQRFQRVIIDCVDEPADIRICKNREVHDDGLTKLDLQYHQPDGAFYLGSCW